MPSSGLSTHRGSHAAWPSCCAPVCGLTGLDLFFQVGAIEIGILLGQSTQGLLGSPSGNGDLVEGALAGFLGLLHLDETLGPLPSPGIDGGQVEAEGVDELSSQVFDCIALPVRRFLRDDQLLVDQDPERIPDGALGQAGPARSDNRWTATPAAAPIPARPSRRRARTGPIGVRSAIPGPWQPHELPQIVLYALPCARLRAQVLSRPERHVSAAGLLTMQAASYPPC